MRLWVLLNLLENTELFCLSKQLLWFCWSCESLPAFCGLCFRYQFSLQRPQRCSGWLLCITGGQSGTWRVVPTVNSQSICCAHSGHLYTYQVWELTSGGSDGKNLPAVKETQVLYPGQVGKIPWRRAWQSTPEFLPGESRGQGSQAGYSPRGHKESGMTKRLTLALSWELVEQFISD